jgi:hypothetical protein
VIRYCRAYETGRLLASPHFARVVASAVPPAGAEAHEIVYLWDDYSVTAQPFAGGEPLLADAGEGWREFCADVLGFRPSQAGLPEPVTG